MRPGRRSPARTPGPLDSWISLRPFCFSWPRGVLLPVGRETTAASATFADPAAHVEMLADRGRTSAFSTRFGESVRSDDVVLDLGTGSGVLATAAALSGARHVYAIESSSIADVAQGVFERNGVADRVTLLRGWSTELVLPEPATLMVTEMLRVMARSANVSLRSRWMLADECSFPMLASSRARSGHGGSG